MFRAIASELREHAPFTVLGAATGVVLMVVLVLGKVPEAALEPLFEAAHSAHVLLSAVATSGMLRRYGKGAVRCVVVGYLGAIASGTLSDSVFPCLGGRLVGADMRLHVAFVEHWWLINPLALTGAVAALLWSHTKVPHGGHVLLSTWASLFYLTAYGQAAWLRLWPLVLVVLFVAVWVPCCVSDIVFPLLFVRDEPQPDEGHGH